MRNAHAAAPSWQGWREEAVDVCALPLAQRLAALLDRDPAALRGGDALPQGWHVILFAPMTPQARLGSDGHPREAGGFAPPDLPRRMLGGRRVRFERDLAIGAPVRRTSVLTSFERKQGRSGALAVASLRHTITAEGESEPAIIEEQDILYREAAGGAPGPGVAVAPDVPVAPGVAVAPDVPATAEPAVPSHTRPFRPDPVMLFRYSAITFNGHRIHYDQPYATAEEGYPGLIVNGGLIALMLLEFVRDVAGRTLRAMSVRNRAPLICGRPARLCVAPAGEGAEEGWTLWAEDEAGRLALEASAR